MGSDLTTRLSHFTINRIGRRFYIHFITPNCLSCTTLMTSRQTNNYIIRNALLLASLLCWSVSVFSQTGFHRNLGQFDQPIDYRVNCGSHVIFLDKDGFSVLLHDQEKWGEVVTHLHDHNTRETNEAYEMPTSLAMQHIKYVLEGANLTDFVGTEKQTSYYNYFIGNDTSRWAGGVPSFSKVLYRNIYPNIDLEYECIDKRFKYNFILNKGADIEDISLQIIGADSFHVTPDRITTFSRFGEFSEVMPLSYEESSDGERKEIKMSYVQRGKSIGFKTAFFKTKVKTVIDPEVIFSTYSGSTADNFGFTATFDLEGSLYSGGIVTSSSRIVANGRYPATPGAFDEDFNGGDLPTPSNSNITPWDIGISKYTPDGSTLEYATYLGGSRNEYPHSIIVTAQEELIVFGTTESLNYPTSANAFRSALSGSVDMLITKFSPDGSSLIGSTYIGGTRSDGRNSQNDLNRYLADQYRGEINLDNNENILIASCTYSQDFPVTVGSFQQVNNGAQEGIVFSLNKDLSQLRWSSYFGGIESESMYGIEVMSNGNLLISGSSTSSDLPTHSGAYQENYQGGSVDGYIAVLNDDASSLLACTYHGTDSYDQILASESDGSNGIYVAGHSTDSMPIIGNVYANANGKQFISKFSSDLNTLEVSTVYGSGGGATDLTINAFLVDNCQRVYISGWGSRPDQAVPSNSFKLRNMPITPDAFQSTTDGQDFHILVLEENMSEILYGTYFGGNRTGDHVDGGTSRFDKRGAIYQSVCSSCPPDATQSQISDFPTTPGSFSPLNPSPRCSNASFKIQVVPLNEEPVVPNPVLRATILEDLTFNYTVSDPENDSLFVGFDILPSLEAKMIQGRNTDTSIAESSIDFMFSFDCDNAGDTLIIPVTALDVGCPFPEDNDGFITIIVDSVPILPPPGVLCLNFGREDELRIDWGATEASPYFKQMYLYKIDPNGVRTLLLDIDNQGIGEYTDFDVSKPRERNYTYYLVVENVCDDLGERTYELNSVKESEVPVDPTYLITATVDRDSIRLSYERSTEDDFSSYEIYRKLRGDLEYKYYESIFDRDQITFVDKKVDVNTTSYCYVVKVLDDCGHISPNSNEGCTIVIRGEAINEKGTTPRYRMNLTWDNYSEWPNGVDNYELLRSVDTGELRPLVRVNNPTVDYTDGNLDYDWGGYWYSVLAYQNEGKYNATSRSNDIYLIQPPEVYVPNAVTANGDNLNDIFGWADVFVLDFEMQIYNRWGEKVYQTTDKNADWTGEYKDKDLKYSNVYFWIVYYSGWDGNRYTDKGTLTILK